MVVRTNLRCCITGKQLSKVDNIIWFPLFMKDSQDVKEQVAQYLKDPIFRSISHCNEGCALRSAFNAWESKEAVLARAKASLIQQAYDPPYRTILWQDDDYLLQRIHYENRILLYFLNHLLVLDSLQQDWVVFCRSEVKTFADTIFLRSPQHLINFTRSEHNVVILKERADIQSENNPYESIQLSQSEWQTFESIVCSRILSVISLQ